MAIRIEVIGVSVEDVAKNGKTWRVAEMAYKNLDTNKVDGKKLFDFANRDVFNAVVKAVKGTQLSIETVKNEKTGYWDWSGVKPLEAGEMSQSPAEVKASPAPRSNYETPEERAQRQVYIIRQSSISSAVAMLAATATHTDHLRLEDVLRYANEFETFVFNGLTAKKDATQALIEMTDDVPY